MASSQEISVPRKKKWSDRDNLQFVELYESEEVLWNVRLASYKNKDARQAALERIRRKLNVESSVTEINTKINNIRSTYAQEKAKIKKSVSTGSGANDVYTPSLVWFESADRFLSGVVKNRKTFQNLVDSAEESINISSSPSQEIPPASLLSVSCPTPHLQPDSPLTLLHSSATQIQPTSPLPETSTQPSPSNEFTAPHSNRKRKRTHIDQSIKTLQEIKNAALNNNNNEDEFSFFAKNIASQLRQLPITDALDVQGDILNIIRLKRQSVLHRQQTDTLHIQPVNTPEINQQTGSSNSPQYDYYIEPVVINDIQNTESQSILERAIRSISGISGSP